MNTNYLKIVEIDGEEYYLYTSLTKFDRNFLLNNLDKIKSVEINVGNKPKYYYYVKRGISVHLIPHLQSGMWITDPLYKEGKLSTLKVFRDLKI